ncbi:unnamed protein product [Brassicogethes aeneus]|uniref:Uncharacterized protein n=1 Tax=Brassicogethes aeneus TaxID=1431903 RepID=A0A9P0B552_BRAAE|nr:unnamed protein product [Brassicogethes aeneus]
MPYYSDFSSPSSSYSSFYSPGPYSNHSSILASNYSSPYKTIIPRSYRGYKPHLSTISEAQSALRRLNAPKLILGSSSNVVVPKPIKINTADIDVSSNKYRKYRTSPKTEKQNEPKPLLSPRTSLEEKEAKPNTNIRRDRATVRLKTIHKDTIERDLNNIKSWRDNFEPDELNVKEKIQKKSPGELLVEKFLIRSRSKENMLNKSKINRRVSVKKPLSKSTSFKDICTAISSETVNEELNPGQPIEIQRRQSRQYSSDDILKELRRNSKELTEVEAKLLDQILDENDNISILEPIQEKGKAKKERNDTKGSVRKRKVTKKNSDELLIDSNDSDTKLKSTIQRRPTQKKIRRSSTDTSLPSNDAVDENLEREYQEAIRDISQVEVETIKIKPKPIITATVDIDEKQTLIPVVDDIEIEESPTRKKAKAFRFNVIVEEVEEQKRRSGSNTPETKHRSRSSTPTDEIKKKSTLKRKPSVKTAEAGKFHLPQAKTPVVSNIVLKKQSSHLSNIVEEDDKAEDAEEVKINLETARDVLKNKNTFMKKDDLRLPLKKDVLSKSNVEISSNKIFNDKNNKLGAEVPKILGLLPSKNDVLSKSNEEIANKGPEELPKIQTTFMKKDLDNSKPLEKKLIEEIAKTPEPILKKEEIKTSLPNTSKSNVEFSNKNIENRLDKTSKSLDEENKVEKKLTKFSKSLDEENKTENKLDEISKTVDEENKIKNKLVKTTKSPDKENKIEKKFSKVSKSLDEENISESKLVKTSKSLDDAKLDKKPENVDLRKEKEENDEDEKEEIKEVKTGKIKVVKPNKNQMEDVVIGEEPEEEFKTEDTNEETVAPGKITSKRSLIQKANNPDPDLSVFVLPPEVLAQMEEPPKKEEEKEKEEEKFVPLQSNRISAWMHPWKKPEQLEECPIEIYARPKPIKGRHYPRPRHPVSSEEESSDESEESEESSSSDEEETSEEEKGQNGTTYGKIGASTSSNDSGFDSEAKGRRNKGSSETRDSPAPLANNPAYAPDEEAADGYTASSTFQSFQKTGRITPPATTIPRFRKYCVEDFNFLKVLGKGSFGKVLLAELKDTEYYYAIKCLKKDVVLEDDDVECTLIERKVLALGTKHPYLCHLLCTFQTDSHLFFVMEYLNGGDLMWHIQASGRFEEDRARIYGAEICSGLKFLHNKGIVYRDLKLDNILLDYDGHVRIADFGMCKLQIFLDRMADTFCGTPDYMAPEIIKGQHYNQCVDWWSFGVLLYEMLIGQSPFSGCDEDELFWSICNEKPVLPRFLSRDAIDILTKFLEKDWNKRLGNRFSSHGDIQDQPFFLPIDWHALENRQLDPPFKPSLLHPLDTQYFDRTFTMERAKITPIEQTIMQSMDQTQFQGFSYTNPNATDK